MSPLCTAITALLASTVVHAEDRKPEEPVALEELTVNASPLQQRSEDLGRPNSVLAGQKLDDRRAATLGETVAKEVGVQTSWFGPGVGRPIIRGLEGARVQVLNAGAGTQDVSTVSADHAVTVEPFLADQIEILKGPATLLYGSGAIGGVVNVEDGRIPKGATIDGLQGRAELRAGSVADEAAGMGRIDASSGNFALHADVSWRESEDYAIPGFADEEHDDEAHEEGEHADEIEDVLENSALETRSAALGSSLFGDWGYAGLAVSRYETVYGIPGGHGHAEDEHSPLPQTLGRKLSEDEDVRIDMEQTRIDARAQIDAPFAGHEHVRLRLSHSDYQHVELEGDEIGTRFDSDGIEARVEAVHHAIGGWRGAWGLQFAQRDFLAAGEEAFVPGSRSDELGLFLLETREFGALRVDAGLRWDRTSIDPDHAVIDASFDGFSGSLAGIWRLGERIDLSLNLDRASRAPGPEELFANGPHVATGSFELGQPVLDRETANQVELGMHLHGERFEAKASLFHNRFDDFIFLDDTGLIEDELPVRQWTQSDARFTGFELEGIWTLADGDSGRWQLRAFHDRVNGRLVGGGYLPRIAPPRSGLGLEWSRDGWRAALEGVRHHAQDRVATREEPSDGYTLVDATLAWQLPLASAEWEVFVEGRNLGDQEARPHTSFLREVAQLPGRGFAIGLRSWF